jgi:hypothetical protein
VVALLPGGVPDVELHGGLVQGQHLREEGGSDRRLLETNTSEYIKTRSGNPNHKYRRITRHVVCVPGTRSRALWRTEQQCSSSRLPGPREAPASKSMALR